MKSRPTALIAVAAVTTLVGFGGSATAAALVTGRQIKDGTITSADIRNDSLTGVDVRDDSLTQADFFDLVAGPTGPKGDPGPAGTPGSSGLSYQVAGFTVPKKEALGLNVLCPDGTEVISGGGSNTGLGELTGSAPRDADGTGWSIYVRNPSDRAISIYAWALCVTEAS